MCIAREDTHYMCSHIMNLKMSFQGFTLAFIKLGWGRVSSKQTKINFGSNRNKPKQDLFRVCFGLFCETKNKNFGLFQFVSVF
jgi:hypothetical protein